MSTQNPIQGIRQIKGHDRSMQVSHQKAGGAGRPWLRRRCRSTPKMQVDHRSAGRESNKMIYPIVLPLPYELSQPSAPERVSLGEQRRPGDRATGRPCPCPNRPCPPQPRPSRSGQHGPRLPRCRRVASVLGVPLACWLQAVLYAKHIEARIPRATEGAERCLDFMIRRASLNPCLASAATHRFICSARSGYRDVSGKRYCDRTTVSATCMSPANRSSMAPVGEDHARSTTNWSSSGFPRSW